MLALGCRTALNLDGGGSTAAGVTYPGYASGATANVPSDGKLRECANFIFLVRQKQDAGTASKLYLYPFGGYALPGAKISLTVKAADSSYMAAAVPTNVTFGGTNVTQTSGSTVTVEPGTRGAATVTATAGSLRANATFTIPAAPTSITIKHEGKNTPLTALHVAGGSKTDLTATAWYYGNQVYSADESFSWAVTGGIGEIDESGVFAAAKTGSDLNGTITVSYGETSFALKVTVGSSQPFADTKGHWAESYITDLYYAGTLQGLHKGRQALLPPRRQHDAAGVHRCHDALSRHGSERVSERFAPVCRQQFDRRLGKIRNAGGVLARLSHRLQNKRPASGQARRNDLAAGGHDDPLTHKGLPRS